MWDQALPRWREWLQATNHSRQTVRLRTHQLRRFAEAHQRGFLVSPEDVARYLARSDWSTETKRSALAALRSFYGWAKASGRVEVDPSRLIGTIRPSVHPPRPAPETVIREALATPDGRIRMMLLLAARQGLRRGEISRVHSRDLVPDLLGWSLVVHGKGGKDRVVPLADDVARELQGRQPPDLNPTRRPRYPPWRGLRHAPKERPMKPYYKDEFATLFLGDCLEVTDWLAADVLVTDPPYGINWTRSGLSRLSSSSKKAGRYGSDGIVNFSHDDHGISGDGDTKIRDAVLGIWGDRPAICFGSIRLRPPDKTKLVAIYGKPLDAGQQHVIAGVARSVEAIYFLGSHQKGGAGRSAVFQTGARSAGGGGSMKDPVGLSRKYKHPHAKPADVMESLIALTAGIVADPFSGSGSTLVAAKALGRKSIGVELNERYCEIAARRLAQDVLDFSGASA